MKIKNKIAAVLLSLFLIFNFSDVVYANAPNFDESRNIGIAVVEKETKSLLYGVNENKKLYPASTTKVMTALLTLENVKNLENTLKVSKELSMTPAYSSLAYLKKNEKISYNDLLYALMLPSGNDAAIVLAVNVGRVIADDPTLSYKDSYKVFINEMNKKCKELNLNHTHFVNPHGFHDKNHYTTALDLTNLTIYASENDTFKKVVKTGKYKCVTNKNTHIWYNSNYLIRSSFKDAFYPYATGVKTGYTESAGRCLVFSSRKDGTEFYGAFLHDSASKIFKDARSILKYADNESKKLDVISARKSAFKYKLVNSSFLSADKIAIKTGEDVSIYVDKNYEDEPELEFIPNSEFLVASEEKENRYILNKNIEKDFNIGKIRVKVGDKTVKTLNAYAKNNASIAGKYDIYIQNIALITFFSCLIILTLITIYNYRQRKKGRRRKIKLKRSQAHRYKKNKANVSNAPGKRKVRKIKRSPKKIKIKRGRRR